MFFYKSMFSSFVIPSFIRPHPCLPRLPRNDNIAYALVTCTHIQFKHDSDLARFFIFLFF